MQNCEEAIRKLLTRNVEEVIEKDHLEQALASGKKLRVKLGIDPTAPDLHLGHAVVLWKLREFQELGHAIILIIGDFTAKIGDPSGRSAARKPLSQKEIKSNMKQFVSQAGKILDIKKTETRYNSEWFLKEGVEKMMELASASSMQQVLRRADFKNRLEKDEDVTMLEVFYPLLQGYDSVKVKADVEIGGTDQKLNLLMGRRIQRHFGIPEQDIVTVPLLEGLDGVRKMSKSLGNYIGLEESPDAMFSKTMSIPDTLMRKYFFLCTDIDKEKFEKMEKTHTPRDLKSQLAYQIVSRYHGEKKAKQAQEYFDALFSKRETPENLPEVRIGKKELSVLDLVLKAGALESKSGARRLIEQGGIDVNGVTKKDPNEILTLSTGDTLKIGKKHFFRIRL